MNGRWSILALAPLGSEEPLDWRGAADAARALGGDGETGFDILACGPVADGEPPAEMLAGGARQLIWAARPHADGRTFSPAQLAQDFAEALAAVGQDLERLLVLCPAGPAGQELAADLGARLGASLLGRCAALDFDGGQLLARRPVFGGRAELGLSCGEGCCIALTRGADEALAPAGGASPVRRVTLGAPMAAPLAISRQPLGEQKTRLEGARLVVSGGRGVDEAGFALLDRLAERLGGALGASLPAVDAGLAPVSRQVGQSGKFVTPELYLAVGVSGTPQHLAGVGEGARIIAINKDPEAAIFDFAEVGMVADWRDALPALIEALG